MTAPAVTARPRREPKPGSVTWAIQNFIQALIHWRDNLRGTLAFLVAASIAVIVNFTVQYPGGVILAIPVLMMPIVQHNFRLAVIRTVTAVISTLLTLLIVRLFHEQPWVLACLTFAAIIVGLYLVVHGLDLLTWMICIAVPVLSLWAGAAGEAVTASLFENFNRLMIGLISAEFISIVMLRSAAEPLLRTRLAELFEALAKTVLLPPTDRSEKGLPSWSTESSDEIEQLLLKIRVEMGRQAVRYRNMHRLSFAALSLLGGSSMWKITANDPWREEWVRSLGKLPEQVRQLTAAQLREVAEATRDCRNARQVPGLAKALEACRAATEQRLRAPSDGMSIDDSASLAHHVMQFQIINDILMETLNWTGRTPSQDSRWMPIPGPDRTGPRPLLQTMLQLLKTPDRWALTFALKGGLVGLIAFGIASVYTWWGGVTVLLLMALFLSALNMGAVTSGFILRAVGLVGALFVTMVAMLVVIPIIDDPWSFTVLFVICITPGAIAMQIPKLASLGLSWAMSLMFTLTGMVRPLADLTPLQERFLSVTGATVLAWLVFMVVRPVFARERLDDGLSRCLIELGKLTDLLRSHPSPTAFQDEAQARAKARTALSEAASLFRDVQFENNDQLKYMARNIPIMARLEDLFLIQRDLLRCNDSAIRRGADQDAVKVLADGSTARKWAFEALAHSLGTRPEQAKACIRESSTTITSFDQQLERVLSKREHSESPLLPLLAMQVPLHLLQEHLEALSVGLIARRKVLDQTAPVTVAGSIKL